MDKEQWLEYMGNFFDCCTNGVDGFRLQDLELMAQSATSCRPRVPDDSPDFGVFRNDQLRKRIIEDIFARLRTEAQVIRRINTDDVELVRSVLCWAMLQVADMAQIPALEQSFQTTTSSQISSHLSGISVLTGGSNSKSVG